MIQLEFHQGSGVVIGKDCYRFAERLRDRQRTPLFRHVETEAPRTISDRELVDMLGRSEIQILTPGEMAEVEETGEPPKGPNLITLDDIKSDWERARVRKYEPYLQGWVRAGCPPLSDRRLGPVIATVADEQGDSTPPHPRTLRGFIQRWNAHGRTLDGLVSGKARCGKRSQATGTVRELVLDVIWNEYLTLQRPAATDCYETLKRTVMEENHRQAPGAPRVRMPSLAQFRREIGKIDKFTIKASREGMRAAMMKFGPRYKGVDACHHNYRWEVDSTVVDLMLINPETGEAIGRPTITVVIDCYTRVVVGFYVGWESESYMTFVAAMGNALQSKSYIKEKYPDIRRAWEAVGTPVYIAVDNNSA